MNYFHQKANRITLLNTKVISPPPPPISLYYYFICYSRCIPEYPPAITFICSVTFCLTLLPSQTRTRSSIAFFGGITSRCRPLGNYYKLNVFPPTFARVINQDYNYVSAVCLCCISRYQVCSAPERKIMWLPLFCRQK